MIRNHDYELPASIFVLLPPASFVVNVSIRSPDPRTLIRLTLGCLLRNGFFLAWDSWSSKQGRNDGSASLRPPEGSSEKVPLAATRLSLEVEENRPGTSAFQLASLLEQISRATLEAKNLTLGRSPCDLSQRLEPESWSIAECLDHLARTTNASLPAISKAIAAAPQLRINRALRTGPIALLLIRYLEPPYRLRHRVLSHLMPQGKDFDAAWPAFEKSQSRMSEAICSAAARAIDEVKVQCPVYAPVTYNVYGAFRILAAHERRHLWQIQQILGGFDRRRMLKTAV